MSGRTWARAVGMAAGGLRRAARGFGGPILVLAAALAAGRCAQGGDVGGPGGDHEDPVGKVPLTDTLPAETLKVATLNMAIGFPVTQLLFTNMRDDSIAHDALGRMFDWYLRGYPGERVKAMARVIVAESLDVVGLQEVMSIWKSDSLVNDFLAELKAEIAAQGGPAFSVFHTVMNDTTLDGVRDGDTLEITFQEGHAVLVRPGIQVLDSVHLPYARANLLPVDSLGALTERGTDYLRLRTEKGVELQVFNTHLEVFPLFRNRQAGQLMNIADSLAIDAPGSGARRARLQVLLGDFNSEPGVEAHQIFRNHNFVDAWTGVGSADSMTCCVNGSALWEPDSNVADNRIDYVMARGLVESLSARTAVKEAFTGAQGQKFLASDHRMVIAEILAQ